MKKIIALIVAVCLIIILFAVCDFQFGSQPIQHTFVQERKNVEKVEICSYVNDHYPIGTITALTELSEQEIDSLWNELMELSAVTILPAKAESRLGDLLFVVTYTDGEKELIGFVEQGVISADGKFDGYRGYCFTDDKALANLFAKYADPDMLSEVSGTFDHWYHFEYEE